MQTVPASLATNQGHDVHELVWAVNGLIACVRELQEIHSRPIVKIATAQPSTTSTDSSAKTIYVEREFSTLNARIKHLESVLDKRGKR